MNYQGLLLNRQKELGYFTVGDEDFIFLFHRNNGSPQIVAIFLTDTSVKQVRDKVDERESTRVIHQRKS